jgi:hypothetical protein
VRYTVEVVETGHVLTPMPVGLAAARALAEWVQTVCGHGAARVLAADLVDEGRPTATREELARIAARHARRLTA